MNPIAVNITPWTINCLLILNNLEQNISITKTTETSIIEPKKAKNTFEMMFIITSKETYIEIRGKTIKKRINKIVNM